jgi:hypothetical protein
MHRNKELADEAAGREGRWMVESRQQTWRRARIASGRCPQCGSGRLDHYTWACDECALNHRRRRQRRLGVGPWRPGGRGRPPLAGGEQMQTRSSTDAE